MTIADTTLFDRASAAAEGALAALDAALAAWAAALERHLVAQHAAGEAEHALEIAEARARQDARRELAGEKLLASERDERVKLLALGDRRVQSARAALASARTARDRAANDAAVLGKRVGAIRAEVGLRTAYIAALAGFRAP